MTTQIGKKALIPNPALKPFEVLIGEWKTIGSHPYLPRITLHGRASFEWIEGGAFLILRCEIDDPRIPHGIEIFGSDDIAKTFFMLHFDQRGTSRKFDVTIKNNKITWVRDDPNFSQHYILTVEDNGKKLVNKGKMSQNGGQWEKDLELTYTRI